MITVRFPTGFSVQYNDATYVEYLADDTARLRVGKGGTWVADVPKDALIEVQPACRTYNAQARPAATIAKEFLQALRDRKDFGYYDNPLREIKRELARFNGKTRLWR